MFNIVRALKYRNSCLYFQQSEISGKYIHALLGFLCIAKAFFGHQIQMNVKEISPTVTWTLTALTVLEAIPVNAIMDTMEMASVALVRTYVWYDIHIMPFFSNSWDIDECMLEEDSPCTINANCTNTPGSFQCLCSAGFEGDGMTLCSSV